MIEGQEGVSWEQWLALAHACEEAGIEALFRSDHYESVFGFEERPALDAWSTVAALAAATERVRLGTLVSPVTFRRAGELAKVVATVDNISGGRVELGLGAGWNESEHEHFGFPFPDLSERMDELERQLEHVTRQWAERSPKPVQQRPPLILGGHARPRGVRLAARYADEYNSTFSAPAECAERRARVAAACEEAGREPIPFSLMTVCVVGSDPGEVVERIRRQSSGHRPRRGPVGRPRAGEQADRDGRRGRRTAARVRGRRRGACLPAASRPHRSRDGAADRCGDRAVRGIVVASAK